MELTIQYNELYQRTQLSAWKIGEMIPEAENRKKYMVQSIGDDESYLKGHLFIEILQGMNRHLSGYLGGISRSGDDYVLTFAVPAEWESGNAGALKGKIYDYVSQMALAQWLEDVMPEVSNLKRINADALLVEVKAIVAYRNTPPKIVGFI